MRVLIACEFSGTVRDAFARKGHDAWSCDLLPSETPGNHIVGNVLDILNEKWDLMIGHPPCTYLTYAGAQYWKDEQRVKARESAMIFFKNLWDAPIPKIALENPRGWPCTVFMKPHQELNPFDFGEPVRKRVCLWLKKLPPLFLTYSMDVLPTGHCFKRNGRRYNYYYHQGKSSKERSRFFEGIADAMANQWGDI